MNFTKQIPQISFEIGSGTSLYSKHSSDKLRSFRLHIEFPELLSATKSSAGTVTIAEIGCGAGNTILPLLANNKNNDLRLLAYDYSSHAVKTVQVCLVHDCSYFSYLMCTRQIQCIALLHADRYTPQCGICLHQMVSHRF